MRHLLLVFMCGLGVSLGPAVQSAAQYDFRHPDKPWLLDHDTEGYARTDQLLDATIDYIIWQESSVHKAPRYFTMQTRNNELRAHLAEQDQPPRVNVRAVRGEGESFQIVVSARWNEPVRVTRFNVSTLSREDGGTLPADAVQVYQVGYVNQLYPDVLYPLTTALPRFTEARFSENMTFWVTVNVPRDATPGTYTGDIAMRINDQDKHVPLHVNVSPVVLPKRTHVQSMLNSIRGFNVQDFYGLEDNEVPAFIGEKFFPLLAAHRMSASVPTPWTYRYTGIDPLSEEGRREFIKWGEWWTDRGLHLNNISMLLPRDAFKNPSEPESRDAIAEVLNVYAPIIEQRGWTDTVYLRLPYDEATEGPKAEANRAFAEVVRQHAPGVPLSQTLGAGGQFMHDPEHNIEQLQQHYEDYVDIWSTRVNFYTINQPKLGEWFAQRVAAGESLSWYIHAHTGVGAPALELRSFYWRMFKHDVSCTTFWAVTLWHQNGATEDLNGRRERRIWPMDRGFGMTRTTGKDVGNGNLFYPGEDGPLPSIRMQVMRDGIEDFDLFMLLEERTGERPDVSDELLFPMRIYPLNTYPPQAMHPDVRDRQRLIDRRTQIIDRLEQSE